MSQLKLIHDINDEFETHITLSYLDYVIITKILDLIQSGVTKIIIYSGGLHLIDIYDFFKEQHITKELFNKEKIVLPKRQDKMKLTTFRLKVDYVKKTQGEYQCVVIPNEFLFFGKSSTTLLKNEVTLRNGI